MESDDALNIFLVEDHPDSRNYLFFYLMEQGHRVRSAGTMEEALAEIPKARPDVLISDIALPDGTGWELMSRLEIPVFAIAMTGYGTSADIQRSLDAGFREHLTKPFTLQKMDLLLENALKERDRLPSVSRRTTADDGN